MSMVLIIAHKKIPNFYLLKIGKNIFLNVSSLY